MNTEASADRVVHRRAEGRRNQAYIRWLWLLAVCTVIGASGTYIVSKLQHPTYQATTLLVITLPSTGNSVSAAQAATTYVQLVSQPVVLNAASQQVDHTVTPGLASRVHVVNESNTTLIAISVDDASASHAAALANAVASSFLTALQQEGLNGSYAPVVFQPAIPPTSPISPNPKRNALIGGALGFAFAVIVIYLLELIEQRSRALGEHEAVRSSQPVAQLNGARPDPPDPQTVGAPEHNALPEQP